MKKIWWFIKCALGAGNIHDGSTCWFSERFWDRHDYHEHRGGDGYPNLIRAGCRTCTRRSAWPGSPARN